MAQDLFECPTELMREQRIHKRVDGRVTVAKPREKNMYELEEWIDKQLTLPEKYGEEKVRNTMIAQGSENIELLSSKPVMGNNRL